MLHVEDALPVPGILGTCRYPAVKKLKARKHWQQDRTPTLPFLMIGKRAIAIVLFCIGCVRTLVGKADSSYGIGLSLFEYPSG